MIALGIRITRRPVMLGLRCFWAALMYALLSGTTTPVQASLVLELSVAKEQYLVNEPIWVILAIRNVGQSAETIHTNLDPGEGFLSFEITRPGELPHLYKPVLVAVVSRRYEMKGIQLGPGEQYSGYADLTYDGRIGHHLLSQPGEYSIRGTYAIEENMAGGPLRLLSNEVRLTVVEPEGVDRGAYDVLADASQNGGGRFWTSAAEQAPYYERLLRQYPESGYAAHAKFRLAGCYHFAGIETLRGTSDGLQSLRDAASLYESVSHEAGSSRVRVLSKRLSAKDHAMAGNLAEACRLFEEAFAAPSATDQDMLEVLSWIRLLEAGYWQEASGLVAKGSPADVRLPLRRLASALGLSVSWSERGKFASVRSRRVNAAVGASSVVINGATQPGARVWLSGGQARVSSSVIAALVAAQRGGWVGSALSAMRTRAPGRVSQ